MQVKAAVRRTFLLELTEQEARWLRDYLQNKLITLETHEDATMRAMFFNALSLPETGEAK